MAGIRIELELEDGTFTSRMLHAGESVAQFNRNVGQLVTGVGAVQDGTLKFMTVMRDMTVMLGLARDAFETLRQVTVGWAYDIVKVNAEMERMTTLLTGMSKASNPMKEAADQVKFLRDYSKEAPFSLKALSDTFVKMKATGIDPMNGSLKATVDAVSAIGGNEETLKRVGIALTQMSGKGVIQMEELRQQLGEAIPRAVELMARSVGVGMSELIQQVGKGTVEAKSTLNAFMLELDRTFGGSAQAQMRTFNGMVSQTATLFQTLALEVGGAGFFEVVKKQLADFNTMLSTNTAKVLAESLGSGLTRIVLGLREFVDWLVTSRNELMRVGEVLAVAFGGKIAVSGLLMLTHSVQGVILELRTFGVAWSAMQIALTINRLDMLAGQMGLAGIGISRATGALVAMRTVLATLMVGLSTVAGVIVPLGVAIAAVAYYFGLFSNKAEDAYQSLVKFGAESRKQVEEAKGSLPALRAELARLQEQRNALANDPLASVFPGRIKSFTDPLDAQIAAKKAELDERERVLATQETKATEKEAEAGARARLEGVADQMSDIHKNYDKEANVRGTAHDEEIKQLQAGHKDIRKEQSSFQAEQRAAAIKYYDDQLAVLDNALEAEKTRRQLGDEDALKIAGKFDEDIERQRKLTLETRRAQAEAPLGIQNLANKDNLQHALDKATQEINRLKGAIEGSKAELAGFSGEWEKLIYSLEQAAPTSKSGPLDNEQLKESIELIKKLKVEEEAYKAATESANKIDRELERLKSAAQLKILENATRGKNELDKFATAMEMGLYSGQKPITLMERGFMGIRDSAKLAGDTMKTTFGGEVLTAGESLLSVVKNIGAAFTNIGKKPGGAGGKNTLAGLYNKDGNPDAGSFEQRMIKSESGGDNNAQARNSSALGAGQFIKSTWLEFLKEVHPKTLETMSETSALDLRRDGGMNLEAMQWYKQKNSTAFGMHNIEANDANLAIGHFLGTGGAIAALSKSSETLVTMIPELASAIKANPDVFKNIGTVGDLRKWGQRQGGTGSTTGAPYQANDRNDSTMPIPKDLTNAQAATWDEVRKLQQQGNAGASNNALADEIDKIKRKITELREAGDGTTKVLAAMRKAIADPESKLGTDKNPDADRYKKLLEFADKQDKAEEAYAERKKARTQEEALVISLAREKEVLADKDAEIKRRYESETTFKFSKELMRQNDEGKKRIAEINKSVSLGVTPKDTGEAQIKEIQENQQHNKNLEVESYIQAEQEKTKVLQRSLMTQDDARAASVADDLARMRSALSQFQGDADTRAKIEATIQAKIRAEQQKTFVESPIGKELKDWSDLSNNLQKDVAGWMTASIDKLSNLILFGKRNWRDFMNQVISDLAKTGMKAAAGSVLQSLLGAAGLPTGGGGGSKLGGTTQVAKAHMGGIAGSLPAIHNVDSSLFLNARRYHDGGIVAGEVPIIAKKGEEVGWPDQLAAKYGGGQVNQVNHINVQGSAGTPDQNQDLATRIVKSINDGLDQRMDARMAAQLRPNGLFGR